MYVSVFVCTNVRTCVYVNTHVCVCTSFPLLVTLARGRTTDGGHLPTFSVAQQVLLTWLVRLHLVDLSDFRLLSSATLLTADPHRLALLLSDFRL